MRRVLVVDDDPQFCDFARVLLHGDDCQVVAMATRGEAALEVLSEARPDVAVVDIQMPGWNGLQTAERLRAANPKLRVVLTSGDDALLYRDLADVYGATFVPKKHLSVASLS